MTTKYDYYQVSIARELQTRIKDLFRDFPEIAIEYKKGKNPGHVKFIEEAVRFYIRYKEEFEIEKLRYTGKDKIKKEIEKAYKNRDP